MLSGYPPRRNIGKGHKVWCCFCQSMVEEQHLAPVAMMNQLNNLLSMLDLVQDCLQDDAVVFPTSTKSHFFLQIYCPWESLDLNFKKKQHRLLQSCFPWRRHVTFRLSNLLVQSLLSGWICPVRLNLLLCQVEFAPPFEEKNFPQPNPLVFQNPSTNTFSGTREV